MTLVDLAAIPAWETGPMPFAQGGVVATADVRSAYFNDRSGQALYGSDRVHRWAATGEGLELPDAALDVVGVEVIRAPGVHRVAGSGLEFDDRGPQLLKGVPEEWRIFAAQR